MPPLLVESHLVCVRHFSKKLWKNFSEVVDELIYLLFEFQIFDSTINNFIEAMQDKKILNEFSAKITKAKILHDSTQATTIKLRRELNQLQKQHQLISNQRQAAENMQRSLKNQLDMTQKAERETHDKCRREERQLEELRQTKKNLKREKEIQQHNLLKNNLELEDLTKKREQLEITAKNLSDKLEGVTNEKEVLQNQYNKTMSAINKYNENIHELELEISQMRQVITKNTVPVHNINESQLEQSYS